MPAQEEQEPRDSNAEATGARGNEKRASGETSPSPDADILLPMKLCVSPEDAADRRFAAPIILDAQPFASTTPRLYAFVAVSIAAGAAIGFLFGSHTGVKNALEAGAGLDGASLSSAVVWKPEIASGIGERREVTRLLDEVRSTRAQVESLRHANETLRAAERLRALEAGRDAAIDASRVNEKAVATASTRIDKVEARLDLLERARIDKTPTGSVPKADSGPRQPDLRRDRLAPAAEQKPQHPQPAPGGYVLRQANREIALVEAPDGLLEEVARGDNLPGAGVVTGIEKHGREWVVVTSRGIIGHRTY